MLTELALLLLLHYHFTKEESLLILIRLFSMDAQQYDIPSVDAYKTHVLLEGKPDTVLPSLLPLYSTVRNRGALRSHVMLRLLLKFHLPALASHLDAIDKYWWYPACYDIEKEDDYVTVCLSSPVHLVELRSGSRSIQPPPRTRGTDSDVLAPERFHQSRNLPRNGRMEPAVKRRVAGAVSDSR